MFNGRLGLIQRVLPSYRAPFFDELAASCAGGMSLFAGLPRPEESIAVTDQLRIAHYAPAQNIHILRGPLYLCYQRGLIDWLIDWNPDALIVEANFRYLSSSAAISWMRICGRPVIGWGLGAPMSRGLLSPLRARFLRRFDALIAYSQRGAQEYAACGIPSEKIFVAPNAVAPAPKHPLPTRADTFGDGLPSPAFGDGLPSPAFGDGLPSPAFGDGLPSPAFGDGLPSPRSARDSRPRLLFVGRLQARKRIPSLLRACAELPAQLRPRLVIIGDGPERKNLETLAASIYPAAEFLGALHGPQLAPHFLAADLFALPGTGGLAVQEAMSYGLPVLVARGDGTQDDLVRPANGWQIAPDDDAALASTLREALSDVSRLRRMGAESYRIVAEEINLEKMVGIFVDALAGLTS